MWRPWRITRRSWKLPFKQIHEGDILTGTVIGVSESAITLDLKYYTDGIIRLEDFTNDPNFNLAEDIHVGDEISATVIRRDDGEGHILLSAKEANEVSGLGQAPQIQKKKAQISKLRSPAS